MRLLVGGARAGKSSIAARLAAAAGDRVIVVATAEAHDDEMARRIARHKAERPGTWTTIEEPLDLARAVRGAPQETMVIDCLTLWTSNLMLSGLDDDEIEDRARGTAELVASRPAAAFVVTNEVGMGVHPSSDLGRRFRDLLGRVNSIWADRASEVLLVVAGRATRLENVDR
jgi:adenosyl cobinamide kinase/adenosyl cobinamide phosphate guanylyltransferase